MDRQSIYTKYKSFYFLPAAGKYTFFRISAAVPVSFGFSQMRPAPASLLWRRCGGFAVPLEKTVMFLTVLKGHNSAVFSGLSDEHRSKDACGLTSAEEFWPRWQNYGISEQLGTPRFRDWYCKYPHSAAKEGRKTPGTFGKGQRALGQLRLSSPSLLDHFAFEAFHDLFFEAGYVGLGNAKEGGYLFLGHFLAVGGVETES